MELFITIINALSQGEHFAITYILMCTFIYSFGDIVGNDIKPLRMLMGVLLFNGMILMTIGMLLGSGAVLSPGFYSLFSAATIMSLGYPLSQISIKLTRRFRLV